MRQQLSKVQQDHNSTNHVEIRLLMPQGIIGFHDLKHYVLNPIMHKGDLSPFWLLKSHEYQEIAFILLENQAMKGQVVLELADVDVVAAKYGINLQECEMFFITTIDRSKDGKKNTTVNLRAPVLIDFNQRRAWQIILTDPKYPIDYTL